MKRICFTIMFLISYGLSTYAAVIEVQFIGNSDTSTQSEVTMYNISVENAESTAQAINAVRNKCSEVAKTEQAEGGDFELINYEVNPPFSAHGLCDVVKQLR